MLLVVSCSITGQFEDFSSEVFENSGKIYWSASTNSLCVVTLLQQTVDTTDRELQTGFGRA